MAPVDPVHHTPSSTAYDLRELSLPRSKYQIRERKRPNMLGFAEFIVLAVVERKSTGMCTNYWDQVTRGGFLYAVEGGKAFPIPEKAFSGRLLNPRAVNFDIIKEWLYLCRMHHKQECGRVQDNPMNLWVMDCRTKKLVAALPQCQYIALSYVWGQDLSQFPEVVKDAMIVTLRLGFTYLWIDRYCMSELSEKQKLLQIADMDNIYERAQVTIIAAAGDNADCGLPGIGHVSRIEQPVIQIGKHLLASSHIHGRLDVAQTKWATRAWTYQEGQLASRRLIFTEKQVYFECQVVHCCEAISSPAEFGVWERLDATSRQSILSSTKIFPVRGVGTTLGDLQSRLYSGRQLTRESDAIKAFEGMLARFAKQSPSVNHYFGLALDQSTSLPGILYWTMQIPGRRRLKFPSWTWAGWTGRAEFKSGGELNLTLPEYWPEVSVELNDGTIIPWTTFRYDTMTMEGYLLQPSKFIHVKADLVSIRIVKCHLSGMDEVRVLLAETQQHRLCAQVELQGWTIFAPLNLRMSIDTDVKFAERLLSNTWEAIFIRGRSHGTHRSMALLLDQHKDFAEVIGVFEISFGFSQRVLIVPKGGGKTTDVFQDFWSNTVKRKGEWIRLG